MDKRLKRLAAKLVTAPTATDPIKQWCPQVPTQKQQEFLDLDCFEALYGGAAGGGKSSTLLMAALQYMHVKGYSALILRRTFADLALPNAIMDRAKQWLIPQGVKWNDRDKVFTFPSGAKLQFGYLDHANSVYRYQGSELQFLGFDELTQFDEREYLYLHSRIRKPEGMDVPLRIRNSSNPGGRGHRWVYSRFVNHETREDRVFIPAKMQDNPYLNQEEYHKSLANLDPITRQQLQDGLWVERGEGRMYLYEPMRNSFNENTQTTPPERFILGVDLGASQNNASTAFSVLGFWSHNDKRTIVLESYKAAGMTPSTIAEEIQRLRERYTFTKIVVDAGALGKGYVEEFRQRWAIPAVAATKVNRLAYVKLMNGDLAAGLVQIKADTCGALIEELETVQWNDAGTDAAPGSQDHCCDATLYAWREAKHWLSTEKATPPQVGTPEYFEELRKKMYEEALNSVRGRDSEDTYYG